MKRAPIFFTTSVINFEIYHKVTMNRAQKQVARLKPQTSQQSESPRSLI